MLIDKNGEKLLSNFTIDGEHIQQKIEPIFRASERY